jgi:hypothetical protein
MLSRTLAMVSILLAYVILGACTDSPTYRSVDTISSVSFIDKGAVVPDPMSTLTPGTSHASRPGTVLH